MTDYDLKVIEDLGGGIHEGIDSSKIKDSEWVSLRNMYGYGPDIIRRPGLTVYTTTASTSPITGLFAQRLVTGVWLLMVGTMVGIARVVSSVVTPIVSSMASSLSLWSAFQYKDVSYWARKDAGTLKRVTATTAVDAGIVAPTGSAQTPSLSDGGVGLMAAGTYYGVITGYNSATGVESNPSPVSAAVTIGALGQITFSNVYVFPEAQVNSRLIYLTLPNQTGEYFLAETIADNTSTSVTVNTIQAGLGAAASFRNGVPPATVIAAVPHNERCWTHDETYVYFSEYGLMECFGSTSFLPVFPDDGHPIRALAPWTRKRLFVGKTNMIAFITGFDIGEFTLEVLSHKHGCYSHHSVKSFEDLIIWYGGDDFYASTGGDPVPIGDSKIKATLALIPDDIKDRIAAEIWPELHLYIVTIPVDSSNVNKRVLVYNYRTQAWFVWDYPTYVGTASGVAPRILARFFDTDLQPLLYCSFEDGHIHDMMSDALDDNGTAIQCAGKGKAFGFMIDGSLAAIRNLQILCSSIDASLTVEIYRNRASAVFKSRTVSLNQANLWKRIALSNISSPSSLVQIGFYYEGEPALTISKLGFEFSRLDRRRGQPI